MNIERPELVGKSIDREEQEEINLVFHQIVKRKQISSYSNLIK
jgi:hypothetical protein